MSTEIFETFADGTVVFPGVNESMQSRPWNPHPRFDGVELKHLVRGGESAGLFSYHLVRIAPGKEIGDHTHDPQWETHEVVGGSGECVNDGENIPYRPGVISLFKPRTRHAIKAGAEGLRLLAKFMPPLC